jgi:peptidoglycan/LPS O-acetylase OafA/YrhL
LLVALALALPHIGQQDLRADMPFAASVLLLALSAEPLLRRWQQRTWLRGAVALGDQSYSTYLVHPLVIGVALHMSGSGRVASPALLAAMLAGVCAAVLVLSRLSYRLVERSSALAAVRERLIGARPPAPKAGAKEPVEEAKLAVSPLESHWLR